MLRRDLGLLVQLLALFAKITRAELISDNWGDIVANFFFRDPNSKPQPATLSQEWY